MRMNKAYYKFRGIKPSVFILSILIVYRNQCTTTEVTMARIYNWDVKRRRAQKAAAEDKSKGQGKEEKWTS